MRRIGYTEEEIAVAVKDSKSLAGVMRKIGLVPIGGNYLTIRRKIHDLKLDTSHFTGQLWAKGSMLKHWDDYSNPKSFKKHLINFRGNVCEKCGLDKWIGELIKLELHHVDGDTTNNSTENIKLLCPNCHSFTKTWRKSKEYIQANIQ
jgi:hypothetical protein